ncbi:N-acyl-D-amino-acid deacylase family protein [Mycobacterium kansasii]|uniref:N-acyl-D-amino-acid deacylase family protein n=1 Tax=Mycobacterium kansasii TaxID=1768 RepID=UPI000CDDBF6F|nr:amidohydrolase family protein [Mycobacterium kansasii]POX86343.1 N-acyl-D-glutamate amidohydrolase [Mycobacterium kansasii]POY03226.1 N-acyl-D-glutamate amidohydrolase [Mycobacterium kansasii]POY30108.1 N-acyl-D-glutamate amidohydrolase [Mycobacterium kansasii]POY34561.1 N-acyl-D-glutamate amidohydrolase [Mycobacterium kansasii]
MNATDSTGTPSPRVLISRGLVFDGSGAAGVVRDIAIADGVVINVSAQQLNPGSFDEVIDAAGKWVMPGFLETHSHYDAEIVTAPGLPESVRHGVTTVVTGNCSLSMVTVDADDSADLFARVEAIPHSGIKAILQESKTWTTPREYRRWLQQQPLGPNVAAMLGHSDLRVGVLGLEAATNKHFQPSDSQIAAMERILDDALDEGFLGLSTMTTRRDKLAGDRAWAQPLPSTFARWREYRRLHKRLRRRGRILQSAPDAETQVNVFAFALTAAGIGRRPLRTSLLTAMDFKSNPMLHRVSRLLALVTNRVLNGDMRFQALPGPMTIFADGVDFAAFEEFSSGVTLRNLRTADDQYALLSDPAFRAQFIKDMGGFMMNGLWNRRFDEAVIIDCPDSSVVGRTFEDLSRERGQHPAEVFLDLAATWRDKLRWYTVVGNHRPDIVVDLLASPGTHVGFADSGAHLRSLANYNFGLRALTIAKRAEQQPQPKLTVGEMVRKLTSDLADWWGVEAGRLRIGARADVVVVNPDGLTDQVFEISEAPAPDAFGVDRVVNRNDDAVEAVLINGRTAYTRAFGYAADLGQCAAYGSFLPSTHTATK